MKTQQVLGVILLAGCGFIPEKVKMDDPRIQPLLQAAATFDRTTYGFTPIPTNPIVIRFEQRPTDHYDAMLHIESKTSRTIAFRKTSNGYRWIGEQEIFRGPTKYTTVDGTFFEQICLNYDIEPISGFPTNQLAVSCSGEDKRLAYRPKLTLNDVQPILKEWGY